MPPNSHVCAPFLDLLAISVVAIRQTGNLFFRPSKATSTTGCFVLNENFYVFEILIVGVTGKKVSASMQIAFWM